MTELHEMLAFYQSKDFESLSFCELTEFRKIALRYRDNKLAMQIYKQKQKLINEGKVSSKEFLAAAYL